MKTKSSKKILPATVFALVIVLSAFAVMSTTVSAQLPQLTKELNPEGGDLGDAVNVNISVNVEENQTVTVVDTLPPEFTYINGTFYVDGVEVIPTVEKRNISYTIEDPGDYTIEFDVKVTEAYWEDREVCNVATATWYNETGAIVEEKEAVACFNVSAFEELHKNVGIPKADVVFSFDLTGSMGGPIAQATTQATTITSDLQTLIGDVAFGVVTHVDYPHRYVDYCGYTATYGMAATGDYAYKTDLDITTDASAAISTIAGLYTRYGGDGPQDYSRVLHETQNLSWRPDAKKIVVLFGDNIPHDCDFWTYSTGGDPGIDEIANTTDDLDFQTVVASMASQNITVLAVDCSWGYYTAFYQYLADETGGQYFTLGGTGVPEAIKELVKAEAEETLTIKEKTETQWAVVIDIVNPFPYNMTDTVITDRFGAEIEIDDPFPYNITHGTVSYTTKGKSEKVFLTWEIGDLPPGETARLILLVSTDYNPGKNNKYPDGHQEYTTPGDYELNSGATLKFKDPDQEMMQLSAVTDSIYVTVLPEED